MEEFKLVDVQDETLYFIHIVKNNTYESKIAQQLFESLDTLVSFETPNSPNRVVAIYEININKKRIDLLIVQHDSNAHKINAANKNTLGEYNSLLRKFLMKNTYGALVSYNLINMTDSGGLFSIDRTRGSLTGEKTFVRKYRLALDNIIVGSIKPEVKKEDKESDVGFKLTKK